MSLHPDIERVALLGWHCIPMARKARKGLWKGFIDHATTDLDTLDKWAREFPGCNWAVVPGPSGVWALDVDIPGEDHADDGVAALRDLCAANTPLPDGPHGRSGGGGHLRVFRATKPVKGGSGRPEPGLDTLANRQTFTIPPSRHRRTGAPYAWITAPWDVAPPPAPDWLLRLVAPPAPPPRPERQKIPTGNAARRRLGFALDAIQSAGPGTRNATLNKEAFAVARWIAGGLLDEREAIAALYAAGIAIGLDPNEVRGTIKSGCAAGYQNPVERATGNA